MTTTHSPVSPRLLKGALVTIAPIGLARSVIVFQYNPETVTRKLEARAAGGGEQGDRSETLRLKAVPKETISMAIEIDAADQLEQGDPITSLTGIAQSLASLEFNLYPSSVRIIANAALAAAGNIEIIPPEAPLMVLVWGVQRILPVRLTSLSITEEFFDPRLNPLRAKIDLSLEVLSSWDFKPTHPAYAMFTVHHIAKEVMARANIAGAAQFARSSVPSQF